MNFARETLDQCFEDALPLFRPHYEEVSWDKGHIPLEINFKAYLQIEQLGHLVCFTARENGVLVGYTMWLVDYPLEYASTQHAIANTVYMDPAHRNGSGIRLLQFAESELRDMGVRVLSLDVKRINDWGRIAGSLGYEATDTKYQKYIGGLHE